MKRVVLCLLFSTFMLSLFGQMGRSNFWPIGLYAGLDFSSGAPTVVSSGNFCTEAASSISDTLGNLLFYTDGVKLYDSTHNVMPNGGNLGGCASSSQGALIVPMPQDPNRYYVFITSCFEENFGLGARYAIVDMSLNNGLGDVSLPPHPIATGYAEELAATYHANNCDVWITFHERNNDHYVAYLLTDTGLVMPPVISAVGPTYSYVDNTSGRTMLKFNRAGTLAAQTARSNTGPKIHHFDRSTGMFTAFIDLPYRQQYGDPYAACFSPNDSLLYVEQRYYGTNTYSFIIQYDLTRPTAQQISDSSVVVGFRYQTPEFGQLQLGPDGKIYFAQYQHSVLGAILSPNTRGMGCNVNYGAVPLASGLSMYGMPNFPSQFIGPGPSTGCSPSVGIAEAMAVSGVVAYPNPCQSWVTFDFVPEPGMAYDLVVYDMLGRNVKAVEGIRPPYRMACNDLGAGIYGYVLRSGEAVIGKGKLRVE